VGGLLDTMSTTSQMILQLKNDVYPWTFSLAAYYTHYFHMFAIDSQLERLGLEKWKEIMKQTVNGMMIR